MLGAGVPNCDYSKLNLFYRDNEDKEKIDDLVKMLPIRSVLNSSISDNYRLELDSVKNGTFFRYSIYREKVDEESSLIKPLAYLFGEIIEGNDSKIVTLSLKSDYYTPRYAVANVVTSLNDYIIETKIPYIDTYSKIVRVILTIDDEKRIIELRDLSDPFVMEEKIEINDLLSKYRKNEITLIELLSIVRSLYRRYVFEKENQKLDNNDLKLKSKYE